MPQTVIFDFDGTMVNSRGLVVELYNELARKHGHKLIREEEIAFLSTLSIPDRCRELRVPLYKVPQLGMAVKARYQTELGRLRAIDGIREVLHRLKARGHPLAVISSNLEPSIREFLRGNGMDVFDSVHSARSFFGKHHTINAFLRKRQLSPEDAVYIGDELRDIEACRRSKLRVIAVGWGYDHEELLAQARPDVLVHRPEELPEAVEKAGFLSAEREGELG